MTNEEAVSVLIKTKVMCVSGKVTEFEKAQRLAYQSLEENDKLKAYIARLNGELNSEREWRYNARIELLDKKAEIEQLKDDSKIVAKELVTQIREIGRLKSELESKSKKAMPFEFGRKLYSIETWEDTGDFTIFEYEFDGIESGGLRLIYRGNKEDVCVFSLDEIGVNIFESMDEAEQALKGIL